MTAHLAEPFSKKISSPASVFHDAPAPAPWLRVSIVVPARNEEDNIIPALSALYHQLNDKGVTLRKNEFEVLLLVNNSTDATLEIALDYQHQHPQFALHIAHVNLPPNKANIGTARRMLMDEACRRLNQQSPNGIIASTDSDTVVDERWVYNILREIGKGAEAVGGRILTRSNNSPVRIWHLRDVMYRTLLAQAEALIDPCVHDPWPRHHQYFGANLAVTCATYERAGGLPEVPFLEDHAFFEALKVIDARIRRSTTVRVFTSDRQQGRVEVGFSEQLTTWSKFIAYKRVQVTEPVVPQVIKWKCRKLLRDIHSRQQQRRPISMADIVAISRPLQLPYNWLCQQVESCVYFGEIWQAVEKRLIVNRWNEQWLPQPITEAITELRLFVTRKTIDIDK